jgi:hypothetical protein
MVTAVILVALFLILLVVVIYDKRIKRIETKEQAK